MFFPTDLSGCMAFCYPNHGVPPPACYRAPCNVRYGERAYAILFEEAATAMAFLSVYLPPLRGPRPASATAENAHPLSPAATVWQGLTWDGAIRKAAAWRETMRHYAAVSYEHHRTYDYSVQELF
jgi:hypothetical protein